MSEIEYHPAEHETYTPQRGALPPRAYHQDGDTHASPSDAKAMSLNGRWRFRYSPTVEAAGGEEFKEPKYDESKWGALDVPSTWVLNGHGHPWYTNIQFPFPLDPPRVPDDNPTGDYRVMFDAKQWPKGGRTVLRFDGVESWFKVWLNGTELGFSTGSRLATEFDVTPYLERGNNVLAVRVRQWSAASYLEDQDQWWLPGIFRDVTLLHRPKHCIEDYFVHASYNHKTGEGTLRVDCDPRAAEIKVPELGVNIGAGQTLTLKVDPWTAETPRLYDGTLSTGSETIRLRIGFRTVEIDDGLIKVNGRRVLFRGVNRHEFCPTKGRSLDRATMLKDIILMKQLNVNAVRTSHYPPHPYFLSLCDEYGLWVIDECDYETHGFDFAGWQGNPSGEKAWRPALLNRMERTVERDKNHPSIIIWSLGNEASVGENTGHMAAYVRKRDPSRPLHYEGDWEVRYTDIYSRMYAWVPEVDKIGRHEESPLQDKKLDKHRRSAPFILCEYAHAMGNGPGGFKEYYALFEKYPRCQGGFVWEWIDHGIPKQTDDKRMYYAYGGDFGEEVHDGNFITDGLMFPNREPSPGAIELKKTIEPILITGEGRSLFIKNRQDFKDTSWLEFKWELESGGSVVDQGILDVVDVQSSQVLAMPLPEHKALPVGKDPGGEKYWTIRAVLKEDTKWAKKGHEVAWGQWPCEPAVAIAKAPEAKALPEKNKDGTITLGPALFSARGQLLKLGRLDAAAQLDVWRATTDNDRGYDGTVGRKQSKAWMEAGLHRMHTRVDNVELKDHAMVVHTWEAAAVRTRGLRTKYTWTSDGSALKVTIDVDPQGDWSELPLPRLGMRLQLPKSIADIEYFGLGPGEAYPDTCAAVRLGRFTSTVDKWQTPYVMPQENGARRGVRWATLSGADGGVMIRGDPEVILATRRWTSAQLEAAKHTTDLEAGDHVYVNIDHSHHGIGTAACGPGPTKEYRNTTTKTRFSFSLAPLEANGSSCVVQ